MISTLDKLKIIEIYTTYSLEQNLSFSDAIQKTIEQCKSKNTDSRLNSLKPSRIKNLIMAYCNPQNDAGYIQPIGKKLFLRLFLQKYPSPRMVHLSSNDWENEILEKYILQKYNCRISQEVIRKELSSLPKGTNMNNIYQEFLEKKIKETMPSIPIYYVQLYRKPPIRKTKPNYESSFIKNITGYIYGYSETKSIVYKSLPIFHSNYNYRLKTFNIDYLIQLPEIPGIILLQNTPDVCDILDSYFDHLYNNKDESTIASHNVYLLPENALNIPIYDIFQAVTSIMKPILSYERTYNDESKPSPPAYNKILHAINEHINALSCHDNFNNYDDYPDFIEYFQSFNGMAVFNAIYDLFDDFSDFLAYFQSFSVDADLALDMCNYSVNKRSNLLPSKFILKNKPEIH